MKTAIRFFFKTLRIILGPPMLLWEIISRPKGMARPPELRATVDRECRNLVLYQYRTCPFCMKVRKEIHGLSLNIDTLDAQHEGRNRNDLVRIGGQAKVPCLKITDQAGNSEWMYESATIIGYLRGRFAEA